MDISRKKQLKDNYKSSPAVGGVYRVTCDGNGRSWLKSTVDLAGIQSRFRFAKSTKSCPDPTMREEWTKYGVEAFTLTVLEELKMKPDQTAAEFASDIELLRELWAEKSDS